MPCLQCNNSIVVIVIVRFIADKKALQESSNDNKTSSQAWKYEQLPYTEADNHD